MSDPYPSFEETYERVDELVNKNLEITNLEVITTTKEERDVKAVHITNKDIPLEEKEVFLAVFGRHGNEVGTRSAALGLLEWLVKDETSDIRDKQHLIIIPVANPDGSSRDQFFAPHDRLSELEDEVISCLVEEYKPDVVVDIHSLWYNDIQAVIDAHTRNRGEDDMIHQKLALRMTESAEENGHPFMMTNHEGIKKILEAVDYNNFFCKAFYDRVHSLVFGLELSHFNRSPEELKKSSTACISSLIRSGNERDYWQRNTGYPNSILYGDIFTSIRASGNTAAQRRESRAEMYENLEAIKRPKRTDMDDGKIKVQTEYSGDELSQGFDITVRVPKERSIEKVSLNGERRENHIVFKGSSSKFVSVTVKYGGGYELIVKTK